MFWRLSGRVNKQHFNQAHLDFITVETAALTHQSEATSRGKMCPPYNCLHTSSPLPDTDRTRSDGKPRRKPQYIIPFEDGERLQDEIHMNVSQRSPSFRAKKTISPPMSRERTQRRKTSSPSFGSVVTPKREARPS